MNTPKLVRDYMAAIGARGGAAGKGTRLRAKLNKKAAQIRWAKAKKASAASGETNAR